MGGNDNFVTGAMQGFSFVREQQRQDEKDARQRVVQQREDEKYQKGQDLDKIQAVRYAIATTPEGEDPTKNLTAQQRQLVLSDPEVAAMIQSPEVREQRRKNLAMIDQGFDEYHTALTAPAQPDPRLTRAAEATYGVEKVPPMYSAVPSDQAKGMLAPGNIDLNQRPKIKNADGSISTVRSLGVNIDGKEILIPTVSPDGKILSNQQAVDLYRKTGQHLGMFDTPESSDAYAQTLHEQQAKAYGPDAKQSGLQKMIQGAQGEWGAQLQSGQDQFGQDINEIAKANAGKTAPDGTPVGTKVIQSLHPSDDGKSLAFELKITTVDPKTGEIVQYTAPATKGRGGAADDPVIFHPISELANDLALRKRMLAYADARAVELGSDEPIKRLNDQEIAKTKSSNDMALKAYEAKLALTKIEFEQGKISAREKEKVEAEAKKQLELEREKQKGAEKLAHIKGKYDLEGHRISSEGKGGRDHGITKGQALVEARKLLKMKKDNDGKLDDEAQTLLDEAMSALTGKPIHRFTQKEIDEALEGDGRQSPIPPRGQQPKPQQAIAAPAVVKAPAPAPSPAKQKAPPAKPAVDLNKFYLK